MSKDRKNNWRAIRSSFKIRVALEKIWAVAYMSHAEVAEDASKFKRVGITAPTISRYINSFDMETGILKEGIDNNLTEENILWLCKRWGVEVSLSVKLKDVGKINHEKLAAEAKEFDVNDLY